MDIALNKQPIAPQLKISRKSFVWLSDKVIEDRRPKPVNCLLQSQIFGAAKPLSEKTIPPRRGRTTATKLRYFTAKSEIKMNIRKLKNRIICFSI
jgi:hypothetical protein